MSEWCHRFFLATKQIFRTAELGGSLTLVARLGADDADRMTLPHQRNAGLLGIAGAQVEQAYVHLIRFSIVPRFSEHFALGRSQPELYFALRRGGRAIDPRPWFRNPRP